MCTRNLWVEQNRIKKSTTIFHLNIVIFTELCKSCSILHRHVHVHIMKPGLGGFPRKLA